MNKFRGEQQRYGKERELSIVGIFQKVYYAMLQVIKKCIRHKKISTFIALDFVTFYDSIVVIVSVH